MGPTQHALRRALELARSGFARWWSVGAGGGGLLELSPIRRGQSGREVAACHASASRW